jgi:ATP-binding cassette subfamily B protein
LIAEGGLYSELYRTQFAVADSPAPFVDEVGPDPVVTVPRRDYAPDES